MCVWRVWPLLAYSLARLSVNQWSQVQFAAGPQGIVNLFGAGMPREYCW